MRRELRERLDAGNSLTSEYVVYGRPTSVSVSAMTTVGAEPAVSCPMVTITPG